MSDWDVYGICPCENYWEVVPFGNHFHIHTQVCPKCGKHKDYWKLRTARVVRDGPWWKFNAERLEIKE